MAIRKPTLPPVPEVDDPLDGTVKGLDLRAVSARERAKVVALAAYLTIPGATVRSVWETVKVDPRDPDSVLVRDVLGYVALQDAARLGGWRARRDEMQARVKARVLTQIEDATVQRDLEELRELEALWTSVSDEAKKARRPRAKSLGELTTALQRIATMLSEKRERLGAHLATAAAGQDDVVAEERTQLPGGEDDLDDEEIQALARHLAALRAGGT